MNIFILDNDLDRSAEYHIDKHVVKMILEAAQLLCTVYHITGTLGQTPRKITSEELVACKDALDPDFYGLTHYNHPCAIWARSSLANYEYLFCYAEALNSEYNYRYGKTHKSMGVINRLPDLALKGDLTPFAQAMPDIYKHADAVTAYREYYKGEKSAIASWKFREKPEWM